MPTKCRPDRSTGSRAGLAIQEESCWGTLGEETDPVAAQDAIGFDFTSESLQNDIADIESQLLRPDRMRSAPQQGNRRPGGDINGELQPHGAWPLIMKHALGGSVITTGSSPYVHTMAGDVDLPQGLSVEKKLGYPVATDRFLIYTGCRVGEVEIIVPTEGIVTARAGLIAKKEDARIVSMDASPTYPTDNEPFNAFQGAILFDTDADDIREVIATITNLTLRINNSIDGDQFAIDGTPDRADAPEDQRIVNGDITAFFTSDNYALYERTLANDTVSLELTLTRGSFSWHFTIPSMKLRLNTPQVAGRGPLNLEGTFEAFRNEDVGTDIQLVITNSDPVISTAS